MTAQRRSHQLSQHPLGTQRGWRRPVTELAGLIVGLVLFSWLHNLTGTNVASAASNAQVLQSVERALNLNCEVAANHWLVGHPALRQSAVLYYRLYYLPLAGVLLWVLLRRPDVYPRIRSTLVVMASAALLVFWLVPMSPPRFALTGIVDVVAEHDIFGGGSHAVVSVQHHVSAMPSLHVGWSALCAYAAWLSLRGTHPRLAVLAWLFPPVMVAVVITTGSHYVLDVAGSVVLLMTSIAAAMSWDRWRRHRSARSTSGTSPVS